MTELARRLGPGDAVAIGLGSMIGAGAFVVWGPAARAAGSWLLLSLLLAAIVAACNAWSSGALAARYPSAGGTYVYGRERIGPFAGYLAGWSFVVGKIASCAAMAMAIAAYVAPGQERLAAVVAVLVITVLNLSGVQRSAGVSKVIVTIVLAVLAAVLVAGLAGGTGSAHPGMWTQGATPYGVLQGAGLIFFAFAGYARIATLAEEVRDPERTIPRAIAITVVTVLGLYAILAVLTLGILGPEQLAVVPDPVAAATAVVLGEPWVWAVRAVAALAACGALLNLILGISRTSLAMARDGYLPQVLTRIDRRQVPRNAELAVGAIVIALVLIVDLRGAIGFSSFGVLTYYAVANASAWTLRGDWRGAPVVPAAGLVGCVVLAVMLPWQSVVAGVVVLAVGTVWFLIFQWRSRQHA
ncbi:APC family permease [Ornithinimicrobium faecis]|uniref:APC family permease n=1 Tax=Ornithinimicrobium faecis TaxID=2934158 RepID=A0ABY4YZ41_9MICO|nr:APC family permease [Ornithinimicrobium sp. HY1793]USQ82059.1 APC family permease [Ornithinimicrobium sp. HY1793]